MALKNISLDGNLTYPALESTPFSNRITDSPSQTGQNGTLCFMNYCDEGLDDLRRQIEDYVRPAWYEWIVVIVYILTFLVGLTGNVLVCFAVWRNRQMRTITNMFIVNLSIADLGILIICLPPTLLVDVTETWFMGLVMCKLVYFLMTVSVSVSVLTLAAIAVERWYAICRPLSFKSTRKRARIIIIVIWIISCCFAVPDILFMQLDSYVPYFVSTLLVTCRPNWDKQTIYQIASMTLLYLLPMIFIGFAYIQIAFVLWKGDIPGENKARTGSTRPMMNSEKINVANEQLAARRKAAQMLISVVVAFAVCYFPVHLLNILRYADVHKSIPKNGFRVYNYIAHWLPYLNSSTNPIIYNFMSAKFRKEFLQACRCSYRITGKNMGRPGTTFSSTHYSGHYSTHDGHRPSCHTEHISLTAVR